MQFFKAQKNRREGYAHGERGFELVEVVLAAGILSVTLLAIISIAGRSIVVSRRALETYTASTLLEEGAEAVRIVRDGGWVGVSTLVPGATYYPVYDLGTDSWSLSTNSADGVIGVYTRSVVMTAVERDASDEIVSSGGANDPGTKLFTESVSWPGGDGTTRTRTLAFYLMDIF
jgi:type II secretory pathway pseudopilin PulG